MFKYIKLAKILSEVIDHGQQLKNVLYNTPSLKKNEIPSALAMLSLIINNYAQFHDYYQRLVQQTKVAVNNPHLLMIMTIDYMNTGKIVGGGKLKKVIIQNQHLAPQIKRESKINKQIVQIRMRSVVDKNSQLYSQVSRLSQKDNVVPELFNLKYQDYSQITKNADLNLLNSHTCVMQSFSSSLPAFLLFQGVESKWKEKKFDVIDACSAPGNKTIQAAQYLAINGTVFAFEKDPRRFQILNNTITKYLVSNVQTSNSDFLQVHPCKQYKKVKFILLDPSCSGSGMLTNFTRDSHMKQQHKEGNQNEDFQSFCIRKYNELNQKQRNRVQKLHEFQLSLLNHAATFQPLRISYSTCSIYTRENQDVIELFLNSHPQYQLKKIKIIHRDVFQGFGEKYKNCLRVDPRNMYSDGFFVSILTRVKHNK